MKVMIVPRAILLNKIFKNCNEGVFYALLHIIVLTEKVPILPTNNNMCQKWMSEKLLAFDISDRNQIHITL